MFKRVQIFLRICGGHGNECLKIFYNLCTIFWFSYSTIIVRNSNSKWLRILIFDWNSIEGKNFKTVIFLKMYLDSVVLSFTFFFFLFLNICIYRVKYQFKKLRKNDGQLLQFCIRFDYGWNMYILVLIKRIGT